MDRSMEWFIGGILVLIVGICSFLITKKAHALIVPVLLFLYGIYRVVLKK